VFDPLYLVLAGAFAAGIAVSVGLLLGEGLEALFSVVQTLLGRNLNAGIVPFQAPFSVFGSYPLLVPMLVFIAGGIAALIGAKRRTIWPALWFSGAAVAALMAAGRLGYARYYALPYVLSIPPALWLVRRHDASRARLAALALAVLALIPTFLHSGDDASYAAGLESRSAAAVQLANRYLEPGDVAIVPDQIPVPDVFWLGLVKNFTVVQPLYPYRFIADSAYDPANELAVLHAQHLHLRYFIGPQALTARDHEQLHLNLGTYEVRRLPGGRDTASGIGILELVSGPGVQPPPS